MHAIKEPASEGGCLFYPGKTEREKNRGRWNLSDGLCFFRYAEERV